MAPPATSWCGWRTARCYRQSEAGGDRVTAWNAGQQPPDDQDRDLERAIRSVEASRGHSAESRAVSEYAGHIAGALGLDPERVDRVRLAAFLYDTTTPAGDPAERARVAARVAANVLDDEAAGWLLARSEPVPDAPVEARVIAVAEAFVAAGGSAPAPPPGWHWPSCGSGPETSSTPAACARWNGCWRMPATPIDPGLALA